MSNYTKATDFAVKDGLPSGDPNKVIKGTDIDTEFDNIQTANNSKLDAASPTFTGTMTGFNLTLTGTLDGAAIDGGSY